MENKEIVEFFKKADVAHPIYNKFVKQYLSMLLNLSNLENRKLRELVRFQAYISKYDELNLSSSIKLAQHFLDNHNIMISIKDLYDKKNLKFTKKDDNQSHFFLDSKYSQPSFQGFSNRDGKFIKVVVSKNIVDAFTTVHEIYHYTNQPNRYRNYVSDMLTESLSYAMGLIFAYELIETNIKIKDAKQFILNNNLDLLDYANNILPVYSLFYIYNNYFTITQDNYQKTFPNGNYQKNIEQFEKYLKQKRDYIKDTWDFLGRSLSIYLFTEYVKNKDFFSKIEKLNKELNNSSFEDCLQIIDIYGPNDLLYKMSKAIDFIIKLIDDFYKQQ